MEGVCKHNQRGYCKFGMQCRKHHINEICQNGNCSLEVCQKRHPNVCKFFSIFGSCKFGEDCAYTHIKSKRENSIEKLIKEIEHLKRKVDELMTEKAVNDLEQNIKN